VATKSLANFAMWAGAPSYWKIIPIPLVLLLLPGWCFANKSVHQYFNVFCRTNYGRPLAVFLTIADPVRSARSQIVLTICSYWNFSFSWYFAMIVRQPSFCSYHRCKKKFFTFFIRPIFIKKTRLLTFFYFWNVFLFSSGKILLSY